MLIRLLKISRCYELLNSIQISLETGKVCLSRSFGVEAEELRLRVSEVHVVSSVQFSSTALKKTDPTHAGKFCRHEKGHA